MKKNLLSLVVVCMALFAAPASGAENIDGGFRGIPWGAEAPKDDGTGGNKWELYEVYDLLSEKKYERDNENLSYGGAEVLRIEYNFQESLGFARVEIFFRGLGNYKLIRKACVEQWGQPSGEQIDKVVYRGRELEARNKNRDDFGYKERLTVWRINEFYISLLHSNVKEREGFLTIYPDNYYEAFKNDNDKYYEKYELHKELLKIERAIFPE